MPVNLAYLRSRRDEILRLAAEHGARNVRIFGSVARGEEDAASDVDVLVEMEPGHSLLDRAALLVRLRELLRCEVDVATEKSLRPRVREKVMREAVPL
jgi:predicted nucleotidyltransferase